MTENELIAEGLANDPIVECEICGSMQDTISPCTPCYVSQATYAFLRNAEFEVIEVTTWQ